MNDEKKNPYADLLKVEYRKSRAHKQMSIYDRAAQFAPFAALKGYEEAIGESSRLTDRKHDLSESALQELDEKLQMLEACIEDRPEVTVVVFEPDLRKEGGSYVPHTFRVKSIDPIGRFLVSTAQERFSLEEIAELDSPVFRAFEDK